MKPRNVPFSLAFRHTSAFKAKLKVSHYQQQQSKQVREKRTHSKAKHSSNSATSIRKTQGSPVTLSATKQSSAVSNQRTQGCLGMQPNDESIPNVNSPTQLPQESVDFLTLQTYNLKQLGKSQQSENVYYPRSPWSHNFASSNPFFSNNVLDSYVSNLKEHNQHIPDTVKVLLRIRQQEESRLRSKRRSNRKSAAESRDRERKLIESLVAEHKRLRRDALILSHIPDAIIAIGLDGTIKFCNAQMTRITKYDAHDVVGHSIKDFLLPESWRPLRKLIDDMEDAEKMASGEGWIYSDSGGSDDDTSSENCGIDGIFISPSMKGKRDNASKSCDDTLNIALPFKKKRKKLEMKDSDTPSNADSKLSSLADHPKTSFPNGNNSEIHGAMLKNGAKPYCSISEHMTSKSSSSFSAHSQTSESSSDFTEDASLFMENTTTIDG